MLLRGRDACGTAASSTGFRRSTSSTSSPTGSSSSRRSSSDSSCTLSIASTFRRAWPRTRPRRSTRALPRLPRPVLGRPRFPSRRARRRRFRRARRDLRPQRRAGRGVPRCSPRGAPEAPHEARALATRPFLARRRPRDPRRGASARAPPRSPAIRGRARRRACSRTAERAAAARAQPWGRRSEAARQPVYGSRRFRTSMTPLERHRSIVVEGVRLDDQQRVRYR